MKAVTAVSVAIAAVSSNISYAQPAPVFHMPAALPGGLRYLQPEDAPQTALALTSHLNSAQQRAGSTNQAVAPQGGDEVTQMISRPKTPIEFVRNLKFIFDRDLLLRDDFYTDASLENAFNLETAQATRTDRENGDHRISVISRIYFPALSPTKNPGQDALAPPAQLVGGKTTRQSGSITAGVNFLINKGGPNFDEVKGIFGVNFVLLVPERPQHGTPLRATDPHGNELWKYRQIDGKAEKTIVISFDFSGKLSGILIELTNKK